MSTRSMRTKRRGKTPVQSALLAAILVAGCQGGSVSEQYSRMAALEQYLMADSSAEIAMARSAAPQAISQDACEPILSIDCGFIAASAENKNTCIL